MINRLIEILGQEAALFESFLELLEQQQQMLVNNDREGLLLITDRQREKLVENQLLNNERVELTEKIKSANAIEGDLNVTRLLELVDENQAQQLARLRQVIYELHDKITEVRNQNAMLLDRSREYIARMMKMMSNLHGGSSAYRFDGVGTEGNNVVAIDRRV